MPSARAGIKAIGLGVLARGGPAWVGRAIRRTDAVVLSYHDIVPDGSARAGELALHLPQRSFAMQLDRLQRTHDVVPLAELLEPDGRMRRAASRPRAAITFDDAYRGAVTAGASELAQRGLPATFFVAPHFLGGKSFWWDVLADPGTGELPAGVREHALSALAGRDDLVRRWAREAGLALQPVPDSCRAASLEELRRAAAQPGIGVASHTWSHPNLAALEAAALDEELRRPLAWLHANFADVLPAITYPYGSCSPAVERAAESAGYRAGLLVTGSWIGGGGNRFAIPRVDIPAGITDDGFVARAAGLL